MCGGDVPAAQWRQLVCWRRGAAENMLRTHVTRVRRRSTARPTAIIGVLWATHCVHIVRNATERRPRSLVRPWVAPIVELVASTVGSASLRTWSPDARASR
jgi:hypothetical protein